MVSIVLSMNLSLAVNLDLRIGRLKAYSVIIFEAK